MIEFTDRQHFPLTRSLLLSVASVTTVSMSVLIGLPGEMGTPNAWASDAGGLVPVDPPGTRPKPRAAAPVIPDRPPIRISGSNDVTRFNTFLGTQFKEQVPGSNVEISSRDVEDALAAVQNGDVDVAVSDRPLTESEINQGLAAIPIGGTLAYVYNRSRRSDTTQPFLDFVEAPTNQATLQQALAQVPVNVGGTPEVTPSVDAEPVAPTAEPTDVEPELASSPSADVSPEGGTNATVPEAANLPSNESDVALAPAASEGFVASEGTGRAFPWGWLLAPLLGVPLLLWLRRGQSSKASSSVLSEPKPDSHSGVPPTVTSEPVSPRPVNPPSTDTSAHPNTPPHVSSPSPSSTPVPSSRASMPGSSSEGLSTDDSESSGGGINPAIAATGLAAGAIGLAALHNEDAPTTDDPEVTSAVEQPTVEVDDHADDPVTSADEPPTVEVDDRADDSVTGVESQPTGVTNDQAPQENEGPQPADVNDSSDHDNTGQPEMLTGTPNADVTAPDYPSAQETITPIADEESNDSTDPTAQSDAEAGDGGMESSAAKPDADADDVEIDASAAIAVTGLAAGAIGLAALNNEDSPTTDGHEATNADEQSAVRVDDQITSAVEPPAVEVDDRAEDQVTSAVEPPAIEVDDRAEDQVTSAVEPPAIEVDDRVEDQVTSAVEPPAVEVDDRAPSPVYGEFEQGGEDIDPTNSVNMPWSTIGTGAAIAGLGVAAAHIEIDHFGNNPFVTVGWSVNRTVLDRIAQEDGQWPFIIRLQDATDLDLDRQAAHFIQDYPWENNDGDENKGYDHVSFDDRHELELLVPRGDRNYVAELGFVKRNGQWYRLARSLNVRVPGSIQIASVDRPMQIQGVDIYRSPAPSPLTEASESDNQLKAPIPPTHMHASAQGKTCHQQLTIDSQTNSYILDEQKLSELQSFNQNTAALDPGFYLISIESGHFSTWMDTPNSPGEPLAVIRLYGGRFVNRKTNVETTSAWITLNGYNDVLSLDVLEPMTLSTMFFDTDKETNSGQVTLLILKDE